MGQHSAASAGSRTYQRLHSRGDRGAAESARPGVRLINHQPGRRQDCLRRADGSADQVVEQIVAQQVVEQVVQVQIVKIEIAQ